MSKVLVVIGTRPEAIKMAPLVRRLMATPGMTPQVCLTGQHREMVRHVFDIFRIESDIDLDVMQPNQSLTELTSRILHGVGDVLEQVQPRIVLVHGDTTTTFAAALAAYYRKIPVGHVEAGLRTHNMYAPWPEELNRKLTDALTSSLYAPTQNARENLLREGYADDRILVTGNTVIDALFDIVNGPLQDEETKRSLAQRFSYLDPSRKTVLVTCHRRESYGEGFQSVCKALALLSEREDAQIVFPVHLNPNVRLAFSSLAERPNIHLVEPLDYLDFVFLLSQSHVVLTDSGGIQEEAPSLGKPVFVMRDVTERPEAVAAGTVELVGTNTGLIHRRVSHLLDNADAYAARSAIHNPYGDGKACERIIASLIQEFAHAKH